MAASNRQAKRQKLDSFQPVGGVIYIASKNGDTPGHQNDASEIMSAISVSTNTTITSSHNRIRSINCISPSFKNVSAALRMIDGDVDIIYSQGEIKQALVDLLKWAESKDRAAFLYEFYDLGGIVRILAFIKDDLNSMLFLSTKVLNGVLYSGRDDEDVIISRIMAKKVIERGGVKTLLLSSEKSIDKRHNNQMGTVHLIWCILNSISDHEMLLIDTLDTHQIMFIINSCLRTMTILNDQKFVGTSNVTHIVRNIFRTLGSITRDSNAILFDDFKGRNIFSMFVRAAENNKIWQHATYLFSRCCLGNKTILSSKKDFRVVVPFLIKHIKKCPNEAFEEHAFDVLIKAINVIGRKEVKQIPCLLMTIGRTVDPEMSYIEKDVRHTADKLLKYLYTS